MGDLRSDYRVYKNDISDKLDFVHAIPAIVHAKNNVPRFKEFTAANIFFGTKKLLFPYLQESPIGEITKKIPLDEDVEKYIQIEDSESKSFYDEIFKQALKRQAKLNKRFKQKGHYKGKFFLIKSLIPRVGETKNNALYNEIPYICTNTNQFNLELTSIVTGAIIRRHIRQVKLVDVAAVRRLELPKNIYDNLRLVRLDKDQFVIPAKLQSNKVVTRARKASIGVASDEEWENIEDLDDDLDETRFVRFNDEIEEFNN